MTSPVLAEPRAARLYHLAELRPTQNCRQDVVCPAASPQPCKVGSGLSCLPV